VSSRQPAGCGLWMDFWLKVQTDVGEPEFYCLLAVLFVLSGVAAADNWPQWRGALVCWAVTPEPQ